ncbi:NUDIX domain-containing protein [Streptacidiphilus melanogenes]|uniref:NUDIX domain-containing protein n=1 Tax=Streptacidiphilus melanogenes TaxID=411235 RepID=UPI0005A75636|nr:NUDIX domain-containing protein [Streptacidiphilus melanogenes]
MSQKWIPPEQYSAALPKATVFSCLMFTDDAGRLLQLKAVEEQRLERWQWPGGNLDDPAESPWQVAVRECLEETGIEYRGAPRLLGTRYIAPRPYWPYAHLGYIFDGGALSQAQLRTIRLDPSEHTAWEVRDLEGWRPELTPEQYECVAAFLHARSTGVPCYHERF